jgi:hypothetical protein
MALQKTYKAKAFNQEIEIENAYIKALQVTSDKENSSVLIQIFDNKKENKIDQFFKEFKTNLSGENPIKQAYLHLKTLPEFSDAVDC